MPAEASETRSAESPGAARAAHQRRRREWRRHGPAEVAKEAGGDVLGWVDERTGGASFLTALLYRKVPKGTNWFYTLGSATLFAFTFQALTGVFLAMYYTPSPTQAYGSITHLTNDVWMGEFVRGMHKWGASVMIVCIFLHWGAPSSSAPTSTRGSSTG